MTSIRLAIARTAIVLVLMLGWTAPPAAFAQSDDDCRAAIGQELRRFTSDVLEALVDCANDTVDGNTCNEGRRDAIVERAGDRLARGIARECRGVDLGGLGLACPGDPDAEALAECLGDAVLAQLEAAVALAYPDLGPLSGQARQCQRTIGRQAERFVQAKIRARARCFDLALQGKLDGDVDCLAEVPPGTGDDDTDRAIRKLTDRADDKIRRACRGVDLDELGFPGGCADGSGGDFTVNDLGTCITTRFEAVVDAIVALVFAPGAQPSATPTTAATPSPTGSPASPSPTGVSPSPTGVSPSPTGASPSPTAVSPSPTGVSPSPTGPSPTATPGPGVCVLPSPIPEVLSLVALPGVDLDTGWTGIAHDQRGVEDAPLTAVRLTECDVDPNSPTCGDCSIEGPIDFPGTANNCFCVNLTARDTSSLAACDPETTGTCATGESCQCFYGPPLPLSSGAVPVCVVNLYAGDVTGTVNIADAVAPGATTVAGGAAAEIRLTSIVHNGLTVDRPCPTCEGDAIPNDGVPGGTCSAGPNQGEMCDINGNSPFFGDLSFSCLPPAAADVGSLAIRFNPATTSTTQLGVGPQCSAFGATTQQCFCDVCATAAAEPCNSNADCPGGAQCGGRRCIGGTANGTPCTTNAECPGGGCGRLGEATRPNACETGECAPNPSDPDNPNEGECVQGPNDALCSIETFRGCTADADCNPPPTGNCATCQPNQTCVTQRRQCFLNPIVRTGTPGTEMAVLAATFCIAPTRAPAVNAVAGLPGPAALLLPVQIFRGGAACGNGTLDTGEQCDPPADEACPGGCLPDCTCGAFCGDQMINQEGEQCDFPELGVCAGVGCEENCTCTPVCGNGVQESGEDCDTTDDAACPGACQGDCTCGPFCGDATVDPGEECDATGTGGQCPAAACQEDCTCGPFCGNAEIDPGEECDATTTGTCAGTCDADCTCAPVCGNGVVEDTELCDADDDDACPGQCTDDCRCGPVFGTLTFLSRPGSDLDNGWTGQSHDGTIQAGSAIRGELGACDGVTDFECTFFGNVGSFCSGDPTRSCTSNAQCLSGQTCVISIYGSPQPLSSGGVPVCLVSRFAEDVIGTYNLQTGEASIGIPLNTLVHFSPNVSQPCPVCNCGAANLQDCMVGDTGTCAGFGANTGGACTITATGPFGPTTNDCPPVPAANVSGGGVRAFYIPATTGMVSFATNQPCDAPGFENQQCWCDGQLRQNACATACSGGTNDGVQCEQPADCPGGSCVPLCRQIEGEPLGEGECVAGPFDLRCSLAEEIGCSPTAPCPPGAGTCESGERRCFLDPIQREGQPGTTQNILASTLCIPATGASAIDTNTGLPGPGALRLFNDVLLNVCGNGTVDPSEDCEPTSDAACVGMCDAATCQCPGATCGNGIIEPGESCERPGFGCGPLEQCTDCMTCG